MINLSLVLLASAEINAYICNAIRWGTDPFVIDIFKINFSKTTMGISKKTEILQTTENSEPTEILKANDCARALAKNLTASNKLAVKGEALLKAIDKTDIPDKMLEEIKRPAQSPVRKGLLDGEIQKEVCFLPSSLHWLFRLFAVNIKKLCQPLMPLGEQCFQMYINNR